MEHSSLSPGHAEQARDPLSVFVAMHARAAGTPTAAKRFNAGEHAWLGSAGARLACTRLRAQGVVVAPALFDAIARKDARETLQYGELVALSGDFYATADELFDEQPSVLPWLVEGNDLSDLRGLFAEELQWIDRRLQGTGAPSPYPEANIRLAWNAKSYVELALRNVDHFGWHNQLAYARNHRTALELARQAKGPDDERLRRALYTNAFADHFLTDGFAAGHIRVPRAEICDWAAAQGLDARIAGALSKLLHDQDGHADLQSLHGETEPDGAQHRHRHGLGLPVRNARGDQWETFCDGQLFLNKSGSDPAVQHAVEAVADSVQELLLAWKTRALPQGVYRASARVPFPDPQAASLVQKFPGGMAQDDLERLWQSTAWYARVPWLSGLKREHLRALLQALPGLMAQLRQQVQAQRDRHDARCLDHRYVDAFSRIA